MPKKAILTNHSRVLGFLGSSQAVDVEFNTFEEDDDDDDDAPHCSHSVRLERRLFWSIDAKLVWVMDAVTGGMRTRWGGAGA